MSFSKASLVTQLAGLLCHLARTSSRETLDALATAPDPLTNGFPKHRIAQEVAAETKGVLARVREKKGYEADGPSTLALAQWASERDDERTKTLDEKAGNLSSQVSTTLSLVFGVGGYLLLNPQQLTYLLLPLAGVYVATLVLMLQALALASKSLFVADEWKGLNQQDLFNVDTIGEQDRPMFLAMAVWKVYRANKRVNDQKAVHLKQAQLRFRAAATLLALMGMMLAFSTLKGFGS